MQEEVIDFDTAVRRYGISMPTLVAAARADDKDLAAFQRQFGKGIKLKWYARDTAVQVFKEKILREYGGFFPQPTLVLAKRTPGKVTVIPEEAKKQAEIRDRIYAIQEELRLKKLENGF